MHGIWKYLISQLKIKIQTKPKSRAWLLLGLIVLRGVFRRDQCTEPCGREIPSQREPAGVSGIRANCYTERKFSPAPRGGCTTKLSMTRVIFLFSTGIQGWNECSLKATPTTPGWSCDTAVSHGLSLVSFLPRPRSPVSLLRKPEEGSVLK